MVSSNLPSPKFISLSSGGEHIQCSPVDPEQLIQRLSTISEIKEVYDIYRPTLAMSDLAAHLRRLSKTSRTQGDLCFRHVCCDISQTWEEIGAAGKAQVLGGVSASGRTLILLFAPTTAEEYIVEAAC